MSHFSFTRISDDDCAIAKETQESTGPFAWVTDASVVESPDACFVPMSPFMQTPFNSIPAKSVDIDSELKGRNRPLSKCPDKKYLPSEKALPDNPIKDCDDIRLVSEHTRSKRPCNILSGISIDRFDPLVEERQRIERIHNNTFIGVNTRLQLRDAYTKKRTSNK